MKANYAAWRIPDVSFSELSEVDKLRHILRYAVLAPSAHNTQPWRFSVNSNQVIAQLETSRTLAVSDPLHRQAFISLGASVENIVKAVEAFDGTPVLGFDSKNARVHVSVRWDSRPTPNIQALEVIIKRKTNRGKYDSSNLHPETLESFKHCELPSAKVHIVTDAHTKEQVGVLASEADIKLMNKAFKQELAQWVHSNWTKTHTGMPAAVQGMPGLVSLIVKGVIPNAPIEKDQAKKDRQQLQAAPALLFITAKDDSPELWIDAGRVFERICLKATTHNFTTAAFASLVEHEESREKVLQLLGASGKLMAVLRVGKPLTNFPRTPRLPVEAVTKM